MTEDILKILNANAKALVRANLRESLTALELDFDTLLSVDDIREHASVYSKKRLDHTGETKSNAYHAGVTLCMVAVTRIEQLERSDDYQNVLDNAFTNMCHAFRVNPETFDGDSSDVHLYEKFFEFVYQQLLTMPIRYDAEKRSLELDVDPVENAGPEIFNKVVDTLDARFAPGYSIKNPVALAAAISLFEKAFEARVNAPVKIEINQRSEEEEL